MIYDIQPSDEDFWNDYNKMIDDIKKDNCALLGKIAKDFGDGLAADIRHYINDVDFADFMPLEIVDKPKGGEQEEDYVHMHHIYVNQSGPGMSGDDYHGEVYIPLPDGKYLMIQY